MNTVRVYLEKGWTIQEIDYTMNDLFGVPGYVAYWIVSPTGEQKESFPTKNGARAYWRKNKRKYLDFSGDGRQMAEECGLVWEDMDQFEQQSWARMANEHGEESRDEG